MRMNPKAQERTRACTDAALKIMKVMRELRNEHNLTDAEEIRILADMISNVARHAIKADLDDEPSVPR